MKWTFPNLRLFLSLAVITGGIYPLVVTLVSLIFFPHQAHGSLIRNERGEIIASELVAQPFISAKYFWPRPSAGEYATMPSEPATSPGLPGSWSGRWRSAGRLC